MSRALKLLPAALALVSCAGHPAGTASPALRDARPNIVLIIADDQNYRDFGFMGSPVAKTPNLDRLAREGTVFPNGYSTSSTERRALASLLTGLYPHQWDARVRGLLRSEAIPDERFAIRDFPTLPRILSKAGYATFQAGTYWEGTFEMGGFSEGMTREMGDDAGLERSGGAGLRIVRDTLEPVYDFLQSHPDEPFFLWLSPSLPHLPHDAPARYRERYAAGEVDELDLGYYANIAWLDDGVGALVDRIDSLGLRSDTLFVFLVDNGWTTGASPLGGAKGKGTLHDAGFRTPIVFNWPERVPAGAVNDSLVSIVDLFPTLLAYADAPIPEARPGINLQAAIEEGATPVRDFIVGNQDVLSLAEGRMIPVTGQFLRSERYHLILSGIARTAQLFDIENDPDEEQNLARREKSLVRSLRQILNERIRLDLRMLRN